MLEINKFKDLIDSFYKKLLQTGDEVTNVRIAEDKWSLREIIGHLIDSASNNHQRFVRLQFGDLLDFPAYDGEKWIIAEKYINMNWSVLISLWYNYNVLLLNIVENTDTAVYGNVWVKGEIAIPLEQLINDYYKHVILHIEHFENRRIEITVKRRG
jgi:hypothetical protein